VSYHVDYRPSARREVGRLPRRARHRVRAVADALSANPRPSGALWMWGEWEGYWRLVVSNEDEARRTPRPRAGQYHTRNASMVSHER
jgi:hypothetical protein